MTKFSKYFLPLILTAVFSLTSYAEQVTSKNPIAILHTSKGAITIELYADKAPLSVANFLDYAKSGFYDGVIFHRVIKRFMIQTGGFTQDMSKKNTKKPVINESNNGLYNERWTLAMARTSDPDSATSQFFINTKMNSNLNYGRGKPGYSVFGIVTDGRHVVKAIEKTKTATLGPYANVPVEPIIIERIEIQ